MSLKMIGGFHFKSFWNVLHLMFMDYIFLIINTPPNRNGNWEMCQTKGYKIEIKHTMIFFLRYSFIFKIINENPMIIATMIFYTLLTI